MRLALTASLSIASLCVLAAPSEAQTPSGAQVPSEAQGLAAANQVLYDAPGDGWIWARGQTYKAGFGREGAMYAPFLGCDAPRNYPVRFRVASISAGAESVAFAPSVEAVRDGDVVRFERGTFTEVYELAPESVEQRFVLSDLFRTRQGGDIVVRLSAASELAGRETDDGLMFENERGSVRYGRATAIDALGASTPAETHWTGDGIEIRVPASFVASARFPLTIDPVIATFNIDLGSPDSYFPDVAYDLTTDRYLTVFEETFSASDHDVVYRFHDAGGHVFAAGYIDLSLSDYWANPSVANNGDANQFLVAAQVGLPSSPPRSIRGRLVNASPFSLGPSFAISTPDQGGDKINPAVGGDPNLGTSYYAVIWEREYTGTDRDIHGRLVMPNGLLEGTSTILIDNSGATVDVKPSISKSNGIGVWNIAWLRGGTIRAARMDYFGFVYLPSFAVFTPPFQPYMVSASSSLTGTNIWAIASIQATSSPLLGSDHALIVLDEATFLDQKNLSDLEALSGLPNPSKGHIAVDSDGEAFAMAYTGEGSGDIDVFAATYALVGSKIALSEAMQMASASAVYDRNPAIVSVAGAGTTSRRSMIVWDNQKAFPTDPPSNIHGALYDSALYSSFCHPGYETAGACPCGNPPSSYGRGCNNSQNTGGAKLTLTGNSQLSFDTLVLSASQVKANALSVFNQGNAVLPSALTFGQGLRCVGGSLKRLYAKTASAGGTVSAPQAGDPHVHTRSSTLGDSIASGTTRSYYVYYRDPIVLGGCPSASTFNTTQSVQAIWVP